MVLDIIGENHRTRYGIKEEFQWKEVHQMRTIIPLICLDHFTQAGLTHGKRWKPMLSHGFM